MGVVEIYVAVGSVVVLAGSGGGAPGGPVAGVGSPGVVPLIEPGVVWVSSPDAGDAAYGAVAWSVAEGAYEAVVFAPPGDARRPVRAVERWRLVVEPDGFAEAREELARLVAEREAVDRRIAELRALLGEP